jgi:hypothetical protein
MKMKKPDSNSGERSYELSAQERGAIKRFLALRAAKTAPRAKVLNDGQRTEISTDHPKPAIGRALLMEALGTTDDDFLFGFLSQLASAGSPGRQIDEGGLNFMLSIVKGVQPKDQIEAMLAAQMAAVHMATMTFARRLQHVENIPQQDSAERAFNKLARTYAAQMEAFKRYRAGGEQKVTVQNVSVSEGGQAIVGNITQSPRETTSEKTAASPPPLADARTTPTPMIDDDKERVQLPARCGLKK